MSDPTLVLGAAAVKLVVRFWLRDDPAGRDATLTLTDLLQQKIASSRDQRRVKRIFEDLEERIADGILSVMDNEFRAIPESDRNATLSAASQTLAASSISLESIFQSNLSAQTLENMIRKANRKVLRELSVDQEELYNRIISDCAVYIIEMSDRLPGFQVGVFSTILNSQTQITSTLERIISELPGNRRSDEHSSFSSKYRQTVSRNLNRLELFGVTLSDPMQGYALSTAYVSLAVSSSRFTNQSTLMESDGFSSATERSSASDNTIVSIEEILASSRRIFIRGEAGSGKSTLLQWLAVQSANCGFSEQLREWNSLTPFLIRLRNHVDLPLPGPEQFLDVGARNIAREMPDGWIHSLLSAGQAIILIDGVDELPDSQRTSARSWLRELVSDYPDARYIVSSRPAAASNLWLETDGFDPVEIQPMSPRDIKTFIQHWHDAFAAAQVETDEVNRVRDCERQLISSILSRSHLRQLATSPLLAALICALNLDRRMHLPRDRMELYTVALDMLLERRDRERSITAGLPELSKTDKVTILQDLAYWLIRNGWTDASNDRVVARIRSLSNNLPKIDTDPGRIFNTLLLRSGILRQPTADRVDFVHRTFQEYLAARAAVDSGDIGALVLNADNDQWREVVIMAAGHAQSHQREELLEKLLERSENDVQHGLLLKALAVACLETSPRLTPGLHSKLQRVASNLLPPKTMRQANMLAGAGDFVGDLPFSNRIHGPQQAAATARLAGAIGGDTGLQIMTKCAHFHGARVRDEILRAWPRFDPEPFAREVLARMPNPVILSVQDPNQLIGLEHLRLENLHCFFREGYGRTDRYLKLKHLLMLNIQQDARLTDVSRLVEIESLTHLRLNGTGKIDVRPLKDARRLRALDVETQLLNPRNGLRSLTNIVDLTLEGPTEFCKLGTLLPDTQLTAFAVLKGKNLRSISDIVSLPQMSKIDSLRLFKCSDLHDLSGLPTISPTLNNLFIQTTENVDLSVLRELTNLQYLGLRQTPVSDLSFTESLPLLRSLQIGQSTPGEPLPNLEPLLNLQGLRYLYLWGVGPVDLSPLAGMRDVNIHVYNKKQRKIIGVQQLGRGSQVSNIDFT